MILKRLSDDRLQAQFRVFHDEGDPIKELNLADLCNAISEELQVDTQYINLKVASWGEEIVVSYEKSPI